jgi:hypothetical protein
MENQTIETLDEKEIRKQWHRLILELGFEEGMRRCAVERIDIENGSPIYRITIKP